MLNNKIRSEEKINKLLDITRSKHSLLILENFHVNEVDINSDEEYLDFKFSVKDKVKYE